VNSLRRLLVLGLGFVGSCGPGPDARLVEVMVPRGATFGQARDSLVSRGIVTSPRWFGLVARLGGFDRRLKAGFYEFREGESALAVLRALAAGREKTVPFTVPEGSTLLDLARLGEARLGIPAESIRAASRDSALLREFAVLGPSLEGYLAPETYAVSRLIEARDLVREMARLFRTTWDSSWDGRRTALGLSRAEVVTLASIVEGEAKVPEDRPRIAGVYLNRLRRRMPLQADPTVQYAIQLATGARKTRLVERDYRFPSPYNTYLHPGLPPGPIGAPGRASLQAVFEPESVPYLFFVARPDGGHIFSRTYGEHLRAVAQVRRLEREARRAGTGTRR
jgi:UPF0755 protein